MKKTAGEALNLDSLKPFGFYEFFAGGGMARLGLGAAWTCLFSNDFDSKKVASYRQNFPPATEMHHGDVALVTPSQLPKHANAPFSLQPP